MMPKIAIKGDPLGFINIHCVAKNQENEGDPFCAIKKIARGLACFRSSGRRFRFGRGSDESSMFWRDVQLNKKLDHSMGVLWSGENKSDKGHS